MPMLLLYIETIGNDYIRSSKDNWQRFVGATMDPFFNLSVSLTSFLSWQWVDH